MKNFISNLALHPKKIFLFDAIGAFVASLFLCLIYFKFFKNFGLPKQSILYLMIFAICCCLYSTYCYYFIHSNQYKYIKGIITANFIYLIFTIVQIGYFYNYLKISGWIYFCLDIMIISFVIFIEIKTSKHLK